MTLYWRFFRRRREKSKKSRLCACALNNAARRAMERTVHEALGLRSCGVSPTSLLAPNGRKKNALKER